jgi:hypothetical protein
LSIFFRVPALIYPYVFHLLTLFSLIFQPLISMFSLSLSPAYRRLSFSHIIVFQLPLSSACPPLCLPHLLPF